MAPPARRVLWLDRHLSLTVSQTIPRGCAPVPKHLWSGEFGGQSLSCPSWETPSVLAEGRLGEIPQQRSFFNFVELMFSKTYLIKESFPCTLSADVCRNRPVASQDLRLGSPLSGLGPEHTRGKSPSSLSQVPPETGSGSVF